MKKVLILLTVLFASMSVKAQDDFNSGYRGFADLGYTIGVGDYEFGRFEISTTHGYQVCPYFFVGAGVSFHFMSKYETKGMGDYALDKLFFLNKSRRLCSDSAGIMLMDIPHDSQRNQSLRQYCKPSIHQHKTPNMFDKTCWVKRCSGVTIFSETFS